MEVWGIPLGKDECPTRQFIALKKVSRLAIGLSLELGSHATITHRWRAARSCRVPGSDGPVAKSAASKDLLAWGIDLGRPKSIVHPKRKPSRGHNN